jgi:anti-sigma factor RsiW
MIHCENVKESLGAWLDGELDPTDAGSIRSHLDECASCSRELKQLDRLQSALKGALMTRASEIAFEPFWRGVQQRIREKRTWYVELSEWVQSTLVAPRLAWTVPVLILAWLGLWSLDSVVPVWRQEVQRNNFASVESIDAYGRNVALFREDETKTTVIWLYQEGENDSVGEAAETGPSF